MTDAERLERAWLIEVAANRFRKAFKRYAKRKHSDAHVLEPDLEELFKLLDSPSNPGTAHE